MIFKNFDQTDVVSGRVQQVSTGMFSGGQSQWTAFYTSSAQAKITGSSALVPLNGLYYINLYDQPTGSASSEVYLSVAYGHYAGSGSSGFDLNTSNGSLLKPTQAVYNQYRNFLLIPDDALFTFYTGSATSEVNSVDIYSINFSGAKVKDRLDPGQFELTLVGSKGTFTFIDDSRYNKTPSGTAGGKRYNIVQGTLAGGANLNSLGQVVYSGAGSMYPDLGLVILNPSVISSIVGTSPTGRALSTPTSSLGTNNSYALMHNRFANCIINNHTGSIRARVTEYVPARHYFIRVKNQEFNYSNNPTFVYTQAEADAGVIDSGDVGKLRFSSFSTDPQVYITTVGLYNENNDLVAVAKLSQAALKNFSNETLIKIRLDV
jgi:hypothetical protein